MDFSFLTNFVAAGLVRWFPKELIREAKIVESSSGCWLFDVATVKARHRQGHERTTGNLTNQNMFNSTYN